MLSINNIKYSWVFNPIQAELFYNTFSPRGASEAPQEFFLENTIVDRKNRKK